MSSNARRRKVHVERAPIDDGLAANLMTIAVSNELVQETDRGCALVAAGWLDEWLDRLLRAFVVDEGAADELLDGHNKPFGSFASRIMFAYAVGLITRQERHDLDLIRHIRNECAHLRVKGDKHDHEIIFDKDSMAFERDSIVSRCKELLLVHPEVVDARGRFIDATTSLLRFLWVTVRRTTRQSKRDIDVARYLSRTQSTALKRTIASELERQRRLERSRRQSMHRYMTQPLDPKVT